MKKINIYHIIKVFCFIAFACFLLTACGNGTGSIAETDCDSNKNCEASVYQNTCWAGDVLKVLYEDLGAVTTKVYKTIVDEKPGSIMITIFVIWMAWQILKHVAAPSPEDVGEFWTKIIRKAAICLVCGILVSSTENLIYVLNTFIFPIYVTFLEYLSEILKALGNSAEARANSFSFQLQDYITGDIHATCTSYVHKINEGKCSIGDNASILMTTDKFPQGPLDMLSCMACAVNDRLSIGYSIAATLWLPPQVGSTITSIILIAAFTIAKICFALYLIDSIFRLDMMIIILPFLIMFYPFEQTRRWTVTGFKIIISSSAVMMCVGLIISLTVFAMQALLTNDDLGFKWTDFSSYRNFGVVPMALCLMGFLIVKAAGTGLEMANQISDYSNDASMQKKLQALAATIGRFGLKVLTAGASGVWHWVIKYSERATAINDKATKAKAKVDSFKNTMNRLAGRK